MDLWWSLPSLFIPTSTHLRRRQARHWLRWVLSTKQTPSLLALQTYWRFRRIERYFDQNNQQSIPIVYQWKTSRRLDRSSPLDFSEMVTQSKSTIVISKIIKTYLEETSASIASKDTVMLAGRMILANSARNIVQDTTFLMKKKIKIQWNFPFGSVLPTSQLLTGWSVVGRFAETEIHVVNWRGLHWWNWHVVF